MRASGDIVIGRPVLTGTGFVFRWFTAYIQLYSRGVRLLKALEKHPMKNILVLYLYRVFSQRLKASLLSLSLRYKNFLQCDVVCQKGASSERGLTPTSTGDV